MYNISENKKILRNNIIHKRKNCVAYREKKILEQIKQIIPANKNITIAIYIANIHEPQTYEIINYLKIKQHKIIVPICRKDKTLIWTPHSTTLVPSIYAPVKEAEFTTRVDINTAQLIIIPALATDYKGNRLGQGGGYYDRTLKIISKEIPTFALIFDNEFFANEEIPHEKYDMKVNGTITEKQTYFHQSK